MILRYYIYTPSLKMKSTGLELTYLARVLLPHDTISASNIKPLVDLPVELMF